MAPWTNVFAESVKRSLIVFVLVAVCACGTDPDTDPDLTPSDVIDTMLDVAGVDATSDADADADADVTGDATPDSQDVRDAETSEVADLEDGVDEVLDADDEVEVSDATELDADEPDTDGSVDATDAEDVPFDGSTLGQPCATHCACNDGQYCDSASGTCQLVVIGVTAFCCADYPDNCPQGATCQVDSPDGGESTCGSD